MAERTQLDNRDCVQETATIARAKQAKRKGLRLLHPEAWRRGPTEWKPRSQSMGFQPAVLISLKRHNEAASGGIEITTNQNN